MVRDLINYLISEKYTCDVYYFDNILELDFACKTTQISFFKKINFNEYDIIHSHLLRPDLYCAFHKRTIKKTSVKFISTIHTAIYEDLDYSYGKFFSRVMIPLWEAAWKKMDQVVMLTHFAEKYYSKIKFKNVAVINNGRNIPDYAAPILETDMQVINSLKRDYILLGTVCAIDKRKGLEQIIPLLVLKKNYAFLAIGDGDERKSLESLAIKHGVASRFKIMGSRENGFRYFNHFNIFIMPSRSEGMPLTLLEAMALKIPIVVANIPAISHLLSEKEVNFSNLDNTEDLKNACERAIQSSDEKVNNAFDHYSKSYTVAEMGYKYNELYRSLNPIKHF
jgi:glycosyltransferase involved in cell wall biosynthesis